MICTSTCSSSSIGMTGRNIQGCRKRRRSRSSTKQTSRSFSTPDGQRDVTASSVGFSGDRDDRCCVVDSRRGDAQPGALGTVSSADVLMRRGAVRIEVGGVRGRGSGARLCGRRSEEHTSELQSQSNLVCRLLLEKKK